MKTIKDKFTIEELADLLKTKSPDDILDKYCDDGSTYTCAYNNAIDEGCDVEEAEEVAQKAHRSTVGRAAGYGVAGIFIWPLLIPAVVDGAKSSKSNTQMDIDFAAKGIQDSVIQPFTTIDGVIFVPTSEFKTNLTINIVNKETQEKMSFIFNSIK